MKFLILFVFAIACAHTLESPSNPNATSNLRTFFVVQIIFSPLKINLGTNDVEIKNRVKRQRFGGFGGGGAFGVQGGGFGVQGGGFGGNGFRRPVRPPIGGGTSNINNNNVVGAGGFGATNINNNNVVGAGGFGATNINNNNVGGSGVNINNNNVGGAFGGVNLNNNNV